MTRRDDFLQIDLQAINLTRAFGIFMLNTLLFYATTKTSRNLLPIGRFGIRNFTYITILSILVFLVLSVYFWQVINLLIKVQLLNTKHLSLHYISSTGTSWWDRRIGSWKKRKIHNLKANTIFLTIFLEMKRPFTILMQSSK